MATSDLQLNKSQSMAGLGNFIANVVNTGYHTVNIQTTIPHDPGSLLNTAGTSPFQSALKTEIKLNSTSKMIIGGASYPPSPSQPSLSGSVAFQATAGDVIHVILTSANAVDALPNAVTSVITVIEGQ